MAGKMDALYNRAAGRDFLDIDAGFDRAIFASMLRRVDRFSAEDFAEYGLAPLEMPALLAQLLDTAVDLVHA